MFLIDLSINIKVSSNEILDQSNPTHACSWLFGFSPKGDTSLPVCISHRPLATTQPHCIPEGRRRENKVRFNNVLGLALRPSRLCGEF
jgi:hypothetical protein